MSKRSSAPMFEQGAHVRLSEDVFSYPFIQGTGKVDYNTPILYISKAEIGVVLKCESHGWTTVEFPYRKYQCTSLFLVEVPNAVQIES